MKICKNIFLLLVLTLLGCNNQSIQSENSVFQPNRPLSELISNDEVNFSSIDSTYLKRFNVWNPFIAVNIKLNR